MLKSKPYPKRIRDLMAEKSAVLFKARTLAEMGMHETAMPLWASAAVYEERLAPLLEAVGREQEAAVHRISAASCYQQAAEWSQAVNLYRAALAGPLPDHTRADVQRFLADCLTRLMPARRKDK
jgi:hypothetical protein